MLLALRSLWEPTTHHGGAPGPGGGGFGHRRPYHQLFDFHGRVTQTEPFDEEALRREDDEEALIIAIIASMMR